MRVTRVRVSASVLAALTCLVVSVGCEGEIAPGIVQGNGGSAGNESSGGRAGGAGHAGRAGNAGNGATGAVSATGGAGGTSEAGGTGGVDVGGGQPTGGIGGMGTGGEGGESGSPDACGELTQCGESCVELAGDLLHCGECERVCLSDAHTTGLECVSGVCNQVCAPGFGDCTHPSAPAADDGCETDFSNPASCGTACADIEQCEPSETCVDGECQPTHTCEETLCGVACVDLDVGMSHGGTAHHCGVCDRSCSLAGATSASCSEGKCKPLCHDGFGDCAADDGDGVDDGCETDLESGEASGQTVVDCGSCGHSCSLSHASASDCSNGTCEPSCHDGFEDCNADDGSGPSDDGCETAVTTATNCGACGHACSLAHTESVACTEGLCAPTCSGTYADCSVDDGFGASDDGCETNLASPSSCGTTCENRRACTEDEVCDDGCQAHGLVKITVPFTTSGQIQRYGDSHPPDDHVNQIVTIRLYAPGATAGTIHIYAIDGDSSSGPGTTRNLSSFASGWVDVQLALGDVKDSFDPGNFRQVTFDIQSNSTSTWDAPVVIYLDHVIVSGAEGWKDLFTESAKPPMVESTVAIVEGSTLEWVEFLP